ncbi:hypothetical protein [Pontibacter mangrovi]|uniref:hypothetical protein n=1 Tax=Pontibacter mangrovi TaxID=2589816 RepID=UPI0015E2FBB0|nr:hypothetical protein [Pontibacter mangrovi]
MGFLKEHRNQYPAEKMCRVLKVSTGGFYYWLQHPQSQRARKEAQLVTKIRQVH